MSPILPNIEHVVVLMFENRSFDNMLGGLYPGKSQQEYDGLTGNESNPLHPHVPSSERVKVWQGKYGLDTMTMPYPDPGELFVDMNEQIFGADTGPPYMEGFVWNYLKQPAAPHGPRPDAKNIMQYYAPGPDGNIPVTSALARAYAVSDRWFASGPVQTLANRIFAHCATPSRYRGADNKWRAVIDNTDITSRHIDPDGAVHQKTVFQLLAAQAAAPGWPWPKRQSWKVYYHDWPLSAFIKYVDDHWDILYGGHVYRFKHPWVEKWAGDFFYDVRHGLPTYSFIEPRYTDYLGGRPNSNHPGGSTINELPPPISVCDGELLLREVYETLYNAPNNLFEKTLLIVTYDEHGGLYDHVFPPRAVSPFGPGEVEGFDYSRYGVRVPAIFINPYIQPGTIFRPPGATPFDHTSIISTLRAQFGLAGGPLTPRDDSAPTLRGLIDPQSPRNPFSPAQLPAPKCPQPATARQADEPGAEPRSGSVAAAIKQAVLSPKNRTRVRLM